MADTPASSFRVTPDVVAQSLGDEMVLVHMKTDRVFTLNRTGTRIWDLLSAGHHRAEIERQLAQEFDGSPADITHDVDDLLRRLEAEQFLVSDDAS